MSFFHVIRYSKPSYKTKVIHNELSLLVNNKTDELIVSRILENPLETNIDPLLDSTVSQVVNPTS
jgi:hypothetical protein